MKIQIEFNPSNVAGYRLIGYENRALRDRDFNDDSKDAGEIGAGHSVTALYEVVPPGAATKLGNVDPLKYQQKGTKAATGELATLKIRYKQPDSDTSTRMERTINAQDRTLSRASDDFKFAAAVAQLGLLLRDSAYKEGASYGSVLALARSSVGADERGDRAGFVTLAERAQTLASR